MHIWESSGLGCTGDGQIDQMQCVWDHLRFTNPTYLGAHISLSYLDAPMSKNCFGCRSLLSLTHSDRVPVYLEPLVLPAGFRGRERVSGRTYCCLACGTYWVDAPPTAAMLPRFRPLSKVVAPSKPAQAPAAAPSMLDVIAPAATVGSRPISAG